LTIRPIPPTSVTAILPLVPLLPVAAIEALAPIWATIRAPIWPITAVSPRLAILVAATMSVAITIAVVLAVPTLLPLTAIVESLTLVTALAFVTHRRLRGLGLHIDAHLLTILITELVAHSRLAEAERARPVHARVRIAATLSDLLLAVCHDDAIVVLGVLQVVLCQNGISARLRISRQGHIFFSDMSGRPAKFYVGSRALEAPRQRILTLTVLIAVVAAAAIVASASSAVLLSLPHRLHSR
jgi:hypothetical protein